MIYRASFLIGLLVMTLTYIINLGSIYVIISKFETIGNWNTQELVIIYGLSLVSFAIAAILLRVPMEGGLEELVMKGDIILYLIRPVNPLLLLICRAFRIILIPPVAIGFMVVGIGCSMGMLHLTIAKLIGIGIAIMTGVLVQISIMILFGSSTFWVTRSTTLVQTVILPIRSFVEYPLDLYPTLIKNFLTYIIPYGLVNYYPLSVIFHKNGLEMFRFLGIYLGVAVLLLVLALRVWKTGLDRFTGAGG